jgi:hypothetical protein
MMARIIRPAETRVMGFEKAWKRAVLLVFALTAAACSDETTTLTREEAFVQLSNLMAEAAACGASSRCIIAGKSNCSCAAPVNASYSDQIDEAVEAVNQACAVEDFLGDCIAYQSPRCEQGQCVADPR